MYDHNPLIHKFYFDDLARDSQKLTERQIMSGGSHRISGIIIAISVAVIVIFATVSNLT